MKLKVLIALILSLIGIAAAFYLFVLITEWL